MSSRVSVLWGGLARRPPLIYSSGVGVIFCGVGVRGGDRLIAAPCGVASAFGHCRVEAGDGPHPSVPRSLTRYGYPLFFWGGEVFSCLALVVFV